MRLLSLITILSISLCRFAFAENNDFEHSDPAPTQRRKVHDMNRDREEIIQERKIEQDNYRKLPLSYEDLEERNLVEVEPNNVLPGDNTFGYRLVPYQIRRERWGHQFTMTANWYTPTNYVSDYQTADQGDFISLYGVQSLPLGELSYSFKYNSTLGSIGFETAYGVYSAKAKNLGNASLNAQDIRIGTKIILDTIFREPIIAPYFIGGIYEFMYSESQGGANVTGISQAGPYYGFGALVQLNWVEAESSANAYKDSGLQNTFLFVEGRSFLQSFQESKKDFSSPLSFATGLSLEF